MLGWLPFPLDPSLWGDSMNGSSAASLSKRRQREYCDVIRQWSFSTFSSLSFPPLTLLVQRSLFLVLNPLLCSYFYYLPTTCLGLCILKPKYQLSNKTKHGNSKLSESWGCHQGPIFNPVRATGAFSLRGQKWGSLGVSEWLELKYTPGVIKKLFVKH